MKKFDLVDKTCLEVDVNHAPFETIIAETRGKAKAKYIKLYPSSKYVDILCRNHKKGSYDDYGFPVHLRDRNQMDKLIESIFGTLLMFNDRIHCDFNEDILNIHPNKVRSGLYTKLNWFEFSSEINVDLLNIVDDQLYEPNNLF